MEKGVSRAHNHFLGTAFQRVEAENNFLASIYHYDSLITGSATVYGDISTLLTGSSWDCKTDTDAIPRRLLTIFRRNYCHRWCDTSLQYHEAKCCAILLMRWGKYRFDDHIAKIKKAECASAPLAFYELLGSKGLSRTPERTSPYKNFLYF